MVAEAEIHSVRSQLSAEDNEKCDEAMISRYIRATAGNLPKATQRIKDTLKWRNEVHPDSMTCSHCTTNPGSHYMNVVGFCKLNRPVMYSCMKLSRNKEVEAGKQHLILRFEQAIRMMPDKVEQWVWVSDFFGFSFGDMNPAMARQFVDLSAVHYPERLGCYLVIDAPYIFEGLWKIVKPWLDPVTVEKINIIPYDISKGEDSKLLSILRRHFPQDLVDWLLYEMEQNRKKEIYTKKTSYLDYSIYDSAVKGELKSKGGHDVVGTNTVVDVYKKNPEVVLPRSRDHKLFF